MTIERFATLCALSIVSASLGLALHLAAAHLSQFAF